MNKLSELGKLSLDFDQDAPFRKTRKNFDSHRIHYKAHNFSLLPLVTSSDNSFQIKWRRIFSKSLTFFKRLFSPNVSVKATFTTSLDHVNTARSINRRF